MKKIFLFATMFAISLSMLAQEYMHVWQDGKKTDYVVTEVDSVTFNKMMHNGHEYVDLGLPSGTLWATCNVGANKPEDYGDYFAWGETQPKDYYNWSTYKYCNGSATTLTKYCTNSDFGTIDNKTVLEAADDAARANWGGSWRMPTDAELTELCEQCTWTWTTQNGVYGYKVTSKKSDYTNKSIFLPAAGYRNVSSLYYAGSDGYYWSSSLLTDYPSNARFVGFYSDYVRRSPNGRYYGYSVRPVCRQNSISQREMYIWQNGGKTTFVVADVDSVTFTKDEEITPPTTGTENGYEWVDLGLSVKWATCNVGATKPEEYGDYFAWGEVEPKEYYDWNNYKWCNGSESTLTKYNNNSSNNGIVDNKTLLELSDDAAHANWGSDWRMPTKEEQDELLEKCTWTWTTKNGVNGYNVTGSNGNSIFLPAAGQYYNNTFAYSNSMGYYWTSSLETERLGCAQNWIFNSGIVTWGSGFRFVGNSVRPVRDIDGSNTPNNPNDDPDDSDDPDDPIVITGVTVKAKVPAHWIDLITVWVWPTGGEGEEFIPVREGDWYVYTHTAGTELNIIFKNGFGWTGAHNQTVDITGITQNTCIKIEQEGSGKATYTIVDCLSGEEDEEEDDEKPEKPDTLATGMENGYEWVDLGLSVKWATCNVGANKPEEYGDYFAWGETEPKTKYSWETYKWCNGSGDTQTKYCTDCYFGNFGTIDNKTQLELNDDAARANWGGSWRMPTDAELTELLEQCTWTPTSQNGVYGYKVTSKKSGYTNKSIFLPGAGYREGSLLYDAGVSGGYGCYWSSSLRTDHPYYARYAYFRGHVGRSYNNRSHGFSVRPVCQ